MRLTSPLATLASALLALPAQPEADVSPFTVGATWVFEGRAESRNYWGGPRLVRVRERLEVRVQSREVRPGSVLWTLVLRDSLTGRQSEDPRRPGVIRDLPDTVVTGTWDLEESGGRLTLQSSPTTFGIGFNPLFPPPLATALAFPLFRFAGRPEGDTSTVGFTRDMRRLWEARFSSGLWFGAKPVRVWYLDHVGPYWARMAGGTGCDGEAERDLLLVSHNGRPVDAGHAPPDRMPPLAKESGEAKIACPVRKAPRSAAAAALRQWNIDINGRVVISPEASLP